MEEKKSNGYKLDADDYENIYLRIREKLFKLVFGLVGATSLFGFYTMYEIIDDNSEKEIKALVESKEFKIFLANSALEKIDGLEHRVNMLDDRIESSTIKAAKISEIPISLKDNTLTIFGSNGDSVQIEFGYANIGVNNFSEKFNETPVVILSPINVLGVSKINVSPSSVTNESFYIHPTSLVKYRYIAIGK